MLTSANQSWEQKVRNRLIEIREHYPLEEQFAIWVYAVLTEKDNITSERQTYLISLSDADLKKKFEAYSDLYEKIKIRPITENFNKWVQGYVTDQSPHSHYHWKVRCGGYSKGLGSSRRNSYDEALKDSLQRERSNFEEEYGLHQRIQVFIDKCYSNISIEEIENFINPTQKPTNALVAKFNLDLFKADMDASDLNLEIPTLDQESIDEKAKALKTNSVSDLTGFANDVAIQASSVVSKLSYYFTQKAARPNHTLSLVEDLIQEANKTSLDSFVKADPGWWEKHFSKPQLLSPEDMPIAELVKRAMALPDVAALDNETLGKDLELSDHTMKVLGAYYKILKAHKKALEKEKERLTTTEENTDDLISSVMSVGMAETFEQTLNRLDESMTFIQVFAGNFFQISRLTAKSREKLSGLSHLAAIIQTPAMDAITQLKAYQLRRFNQFGKIVDEKISKQFGDVAKDVSAQNKATPDYTKQVVQKALENMVERLGSLSDQIMPEFNERHDLAEQMQEALLKKKQQPQPSKPSP